MSLQPIGDILDGIVDASNLKHGIQDGDYRVDGLWFCGKCKTPKQERINYDGKVRTPFAMCQCANEAYEREEAERKKRGRIEDVKRRGMQDRSMWGWTFSHDDGSNPKMQIIRRYASKWDEVKAKNLGLLLWGNVGTGKTFAAACVANAVAEKGAPVYMTNFTRIINALSGFDVKDKNRYIADLVRHSLLVIDDLGAERQSDFAQEIVYSVIDARYRNGQPLIVTTNLTLSELKNPKDLTCSRIYDRVLEMCSPVKFEGANKRQEAGKNKLSLLNEILGGEA